MSELEFEGIDALFQVYYTGAKDYILETEDEQEALDLIKKLEDQGYDVNYNVEW